MLARIAICLALLIPVTVGAEPLAVKKGDWELTVTAHIDGRAPITQRSRRCMTSALLEKGYQGHLAVGTSHRTVISETRNATSVDQQLSCFREDTGVSTTGVVHLQVTSQTSMTGRETATAHGKNLT